MTTRALRGLFLWLVVAACVLAVPSLAAAPQTGTGGGTVVQPSAQDLAAKAASAMKPWVVDASGFAVSRPAREIAAEEAAHPSPIQSVKIREVRNKVLPWSEDAESIRSRINSIEHSGDQALQSSAPLAAMPGTVANFDGVSSADNAAAFGGRVYPPDTNGAVGPNHYVQTVNLLVGIYDKSGTLVIPKFKMSSLFASLGAPCGTRDDGDPIVLYDRLADRWLISQFVIGSAPYRQAIAISQTGDPTGAYYVYCFTLLATKLNDYPHFGVWPDGYYMTAHQFNMPSQTWAGQGVWAFDRAKMLVGDPTASFVYFDLYGLDPNIGGMLPSDADGFIPPPAGAPDVFAYPLWTGWGDPVNGVRLYNFHVDWAVPVNSTFTQRPESPVAVAAYDLTNNSANGGRRAITQPPPATATMNLDAIADRYLNRLQYRNFGGYESLITCQTVNVSATPTTSFKGAVRYQQFKNAAPGGAFGVTEQASFAPDADNRWMGSAACDWQGNLAVGYSVSSTTTFPSIRYAGRLVGDPPNGLFQGEATLVAGTGVQRGTANRWGDYSAITLDPTDDATFWYTQEYYTAASQATSTIGWLTRVGSFKFTGVPAAPKGALNVTVTNCSTSAALGGVSVSTPNGYFRNTDGSGLAAFATMTPGSYSVTANKTGYLPATGSVSVTNGGTATLNLCLTAVPVLTKDAATLTAESCVPPNGTIDPNEQVTVSFCVKNTGTADATNLVATLQPTGGAVVLGAPVTFGSVPIGSTVCKNVTFAADHTLTCGSILTATLAFQDGALNLGTQSWTFSTGTSVTALAQNFDGVTAPALPAGWTATVAAGAMTPWQTSTASSDTAPNSVFSADPAAINDNRLDTPSMAITSTGAKLTFRQKYTLESTFDGGVLEVSVGGGPFTDIVAAGGSFASGGYTGTISSSFSNPLAGRQAWTGTAGSFFTTQVNLPGSMAGQNVVFRFRMGSDSSVSAAGWYVDTITLQDGFSCCVCPPIAIAPSPLPPAVVGLPYSQHLTASGTAGPYTYAVTAGALPTGLTLSASGILSGTATSNATFNFTVTATDAAGCSGSQAFTMAPANLFFLDDAGRSKFCANAKTGDYIWVILTGPGAGTYTGTANVLNGGTKVVSKPGATNTLNTTYDPVRRKANGYFIAGGVYSPLSDANTANNVGGCP
jgi:hypothetical protein